MKLPFQKTYVVHLIESDDRFKTITEELNRLDIDNYEMWITCKQPWVKQISDILRVNKIFDGPLNCNGGEFNITREYYKIINIAYQSGYENVCIIEDDVVFNNKEFVWKSFDNIPQDYDILRICYLENDMNDYKGGDSFYVEDYTKLWGAQMFALSRRGMKYFIDYMNEHYCVADLPLYDTEKIKRCGLKNYISSYKLYHYTEVAFKSTIH